MAYKPSSEYRPIDSSWRTPNRPILREILSCTWVWHLRASSSPYILFLTPIEWLQCCRKTMVPRLPKFQCHWEFPRSKIHARKTHAQYFLYQFRKSCPFKIQSFPTFFDYGDFQAVNEASSVSVSSSSDIFWPLSVAGLLLDWTTVKTVSFMHGRVVTNYLCIFPPPACAPFKHTMLSIKYSIHPLYPTLSPTSCPLNLRSGTGSCAFLHISYHAKYALLSTFEHRLKEISVIQLRVIFWRSRCFKRCVRVF